LQTSTRGTSAQKWRKPNEPAQNDFKIAREAHPDTSEAATMKKQLILFAVALLLLSGCKVDLDTHAVDRFRIIEAGGMVLRLNIETGEVARITDAGIVQLSDAPPGTLPPGWFVKQNN